jgi:histidinol phosphatase-like enzyme
MGRNGTLHTMPKNGKLNIFDCRRLEGVIPALNILGTNGYILSVVTNEKESQPGIDQLAMVNQIENWIRSDVYSSIFFRYCYHHHAKKCACRLPKTGLIDALVEEHNIDLSESVMFATSAQEIKAAKTAGIGNIIRINTGKADWKDSDLPLYDSLLDAAKEMTL